MQVSVSSVLLVKCVCHLLTRLIAQQVSIVLGVFHQISKYQDVQQTKYVLPHALLEITVLLKVWHQFLVQWATIKIKQDNHNVKSVQLEHFVNSMELLLLLSVQMECSVQRFQFIPSHAR